MLDAIKEISIRKSMENWSQRTKQRHNDILLATNE